MGAESAGYRPCLRCRPDRLPPYVDSDATGIVARAIGLISEGALDSAGEDVLASRLGISARHLRRLFIERIGATPSHVARTRRAHFARRLLDESDLQVSEIAFAAGFASVRQMNRVMLDIFHFTPSELRSRRRNADRLVADGGLAVRVPYRGPLLFREMLAHRAARAIQGVEVVEGNVYRRTIDVCGYPGVVEVSDEADGRHLRLVAHLPSLGTMIHEVERCRRLFGLDRPAGGETFLLNDPVLGSAVARNPGVRVAGSWDPFETAIRIILGQQVSVAGATTLSGRLVRALGRPVPGLGPMGLSHLFPAADVIAEISVSRLAELGLTRARAESIRAFSWAWAAGEVRFDAGQDIDRLVGGLCELPGIGPWTAHMIALRAAGHPDAFPGSDLGLLRAAGAFCGVEGTARQRWLEERSAAWRPNRSLAATYLWSAQGG